ncbi:MAG: hypothetical protein HY010_14255 [Acidobacteria bacterium]|nr:hypothetical protein [Acidobacteriota bacterium]
MRTTIVKFALILILPTLSYAATQATILRYRFSTGPNGAPVANAVDSGPFGFNGVVTGGLTYTSDVPQGGKPFSLNGMADVDYITLAQTQANAPYLNQVKNFTLSLYAMPTGGTDADQFGDLIAGKVISNGSGTCLTTYGIYYVSAQKKFVGGVCKSGGVFFITSADTSPLGFWYKVSLKYTTSADGLTTHVSLIVNGKNEGKLALKNFGAPTIGNAGFQVGAANFGGSDKGQFRRNFIGLIDEVKLTGTLP